MKFILMSSYLLATSAIYAAKLTPVDEASSAFANFRKELKAVVELRDIERLRPYMTAHTGCGFGGCSTTEETITVLGFADPQSPIWQDLAIVLAGGGRHKESGGFTAPYWFTDWNDDFDAFTHMLALGKVALYAAPDGETSGLLDNDIVEIIEYVGDPQTAQFVYVRDTTSGSNGYVQTTDLVSPIGLRVLFIKQVNTWKINNFVSGD